MQFTLVFLVDRARFGFQFSQTTSVSGYLVPLGLHTSFLLDTTTPQIAAIAKYRSYIPFPKLNNNSAILIGNKTDKLTFENCI
jgi:hypothetical protein